MVCGRVLFPNCTFPIMGYLLSRIAETFLLQHHIQVHRVPSIGVKKWFVHHPVFRDLKLLGVTGD